MLPVADARNPGRLARIIRRRPLRLHRPSGRRGGAPACKLARLLLSGLLPMSCAHVRAPMEAGALFARRGGFFHLASG